MVYFTRNNILIKKWPSLLRVTKRMIASDWGSKCTYFFAFAQNQWARWAMLLLSVELSTASTPITADPLPSTLLTTQRHQHSGIPTYSSQTNTATTPWWITTPEKKCCTLGTTGVKSPTLSLSRTKLQVNRASDVHQNGEHCWLLCYLVEDA